MQSDPNPLQTVQATFLVSNTYVCQDQDWKIALPQDVPESMKDPENISRLMQEGIVAQAPENHRYYRLVQLPESIH